MAAACSCGLRMAGRLSHHASQSWQISRHSSGVTVSTSPLMIREAWAGEIPSALAIRGALKDMAWRDRSRHKEPPAGMRRGFISRGLTDRIALAVALDIAWVLSASQIVA